MKLVRNLLLIFSVAMGMHLTANAMESVNADDLGPIPVPRRHTYTADEVKEAIAEAAEAYKWRIDSTSPGTVRIKLDERKDGVVLVLDVAYDEKSYTLKYVDSTGMGYKNETEKKGTAFTANANSNTVSKNYESAGTTIDNRYARWVKNLKKAINRELKTMKR